MSNAAKNFDILATF